MATSLRHRRELLAPLAVLCWVDHLDMRLLHRARVQVEIRAAGSRQFSSASKDFLNGQVPVVVCTPAAVATSPKYLHKCTSPRAGPAVLPTSSLHRLAWSELKAGAASWAMQAHVSPAADGACDLVLGKVAGSAFCADRRSPGESVDRRNRDRGHCSHRPVTLTARVATMPPA